MSFTAELSLLILVIFLCFTVQGVTGFGASALAVPFLVMFLDIKEAVVIVSLVSLFMAVIMLITTYKYIMWKEFIKVACLVFLGLPIGLYLVKTMDSQLLNIILGVLIVIIGVANIVGMSVNKAQADVEKPQTLLSKIIGITFLFGGGIVHGAFATGGPLVVVYGAKAFKSKQQMRASFSALWLVINTVMLIINSSSGSLTGRLTLMSAATIPALIASTFLGGYLSRKVSQKAFLYIVYVVLVIAGIMMI